MHKTLFYTLMIFSMIFWGASWVNIKFLTFYINEYELIFLRMLISVLSMIPILLLLKVSFRINFHNISLTLLAATINIIYSIFLFLGVEHGTAGLGGALVTTLIPINTFIILSLAQRKTIQIKHIFALLLGAFGVLTMLNIWNFNISEVFSKHNIYFLLATLLWPFLTFTSAKASKIHPLSFSFYMYLISGIILYIFFIDISIIEKSIHFDSTFWINILSISILSTTIATSCYFVGVQKLGSKEVSSFIFLVPSSALLLSALFLDEQISYTTIIGTICAIIAIYILNNLNLNILKYKGRKP